MYEYFSATWLQYTMSQWINDMDWNLNLKSKTDQCDGIPMLANAKTYRFNQIDKHFLAMFWDVMTIGLNAQVVFPRGIQISFICLTRNHWSSFKLKIFRTNPFVWLNLLLLRSLATEFNIWNLQLFDVWHRKLSESMWKLYDLNFHHVEIYSDLLI